MSEPPEARSAASALSPRREGVAAIYFFGGVAAWATGLGLFTTIGFWFLPMSVAGAAFMVLGMSGGPWHGR